MVYAYAYSGKAYAYASSTRQISRIKTIETQGGGTTFTPLAQPTVIQELTFQFQATQFIGIPDGGDARVYANTAPSTIDEETNAAVAAYATFDDLGGGGTGTAVVGSGGYYYAPLLDAEGRTAWYYNNPSYPAWESSIHPTVTHTKQFLAGHSLKLNVPGTAAANQQAFAYYDPHANFNISASVSTSLWFYPTDVSDVGSGWRLLLYRYIDASNYYMVLLKPSDSKIYVFVNEAGAATKRASSAAVNVNAWNLIIFTYDPATNTLVIYLNNSSSSTTPADSVPLPWTTNSMLALGGIGGAPTYRFTGYLDNFVFWTGKILTGTEAGNMWSHGTIV